MVDDEETKQPEETPEEPLAASSGTALVDRGIEAAERIEAANLVATKNLDRQEALMARQSLGGRSEAASTKYKKTQEELDEDAAKEFMKDEELY